LAAIGYNDFAVTATPQTQTIAAGGPATFSINVAPVNGFNEDVRLGIVGARPQMSVQLADSVVSGGSGSTTLSIATSPSTQPGTYTFVVTARDQNLYHSTTVNLTVQ
jgi:hypothetical protein